MLGEATGQGGDGVTQAEREHVQSIATALDKGPGGAYVFLYVGVDHEMYRFVHGGEIVDRLTLLESGLHDLLALLPEDGRRAIARSIIEGLQNPGVHP